MSLPSFASSDETRQPRSTSSSSSVCCPRRPWSSRGRNAVVSMPLSRARLDWKAYTFAQAVAHNAFGRAAAVIGRHEAAFEALHSALTMMPEFVDPYLNLADLGLRRKSGPDWASVV